MLPCKDHGKKGNAGGYSSAYHKGSYTMAHRVAYCIANHVELTTIFGKVVRHQCDNPRCVEPSHLLIGTQTDNMNDCVARKRHVNNLSNMQHGNRLRGEEQTNSRWTNEQVQDMRRLVSAGHKQTEVAALFGCRQSDISRIIRGTAWKHLS